MKRKHKPKWTKKQAKLLAAIITKMEEEEDFDRFCKHVYKEAEQSVWMKDIFLKQPWPK